MIAGPIGLVVLIGAAIYALISLIRGKEDEKNKVD